MKLLLNDKNSLLSCSIGDTFLIFNMKNNTKNVINYGDIVGNKAAVNNETGDKPTIEINTTTAAATDDTSSQQQKKKTAKGNNDNNQHPPKSGKVVGMCFSDFDDDNDTLLHFNTIHENKNVTIWEYNKTKSELLKKDTFKSQKRPAASLFSTYMGTKVIIVGQANGDVVARPIDSDRIHKEYRNLTTHTTSMITCAAMSTDNKYLISGDRDEQIRISNYPRTFLIQSFGLGHEAFVSSVTTVSFDVNLLLSTGGDGCVKCFNIETGKELCSYDFSDEIPLAPLPTNEEKDDDLDDKDGDDNNNGSSLEQGKKKKRKTMEDAEVFNEKLRERRLIVNEVCFIGTSNYSSNKHFFIVRFDGTTKLAIISIEKGIDDNNINSSVSSKNNINNNSSDSSNANNNTSTGMKYTISRVGWLEMDSAELIAGMQYDKNDSSLYLLIATKDNGYNIQVRNYMLKVDELVNSNATVRNKKASDSVNSNAVKPPPLFTLTDMDLIANTKNSAMINELNGSLKEMWRSVRERAAGSNNNLSTVTQNYDGMRKRKHTLQIDLLALP